MNSKAKLFYAILHNFLVKIIGISRKVRKVRKVFEQIRDAKKKVEKPLRPEIPGFLCDLCEKNLFAVLLRYATMFFLLCLLPFQAFPGENRGIVLSDDLTYDFITHYADYLTDNKELLTIKDISSPGYSGTFQKINSEGFLSKQEQVVWLRFRVENGTKTQNNWFLEYDYFKSNIDLEFYLPMGNNTFQVKRAYPGMNSSELDLAYRNYVFNVDLAPGETKTFYVKAKVSSDLYLVLKIWHPAAFQNTIRAEQLFIGIFSGVMIIMAFYNFFLFLSFKDVSYIYYILFILSLSILQLNNHHLISEWLHLLAHYDEIMTAIFKLLSFTSFLFFSRSFLSIKKHFPLADKILTIGIYIVIGTGILSFSSVLFKTINNILIGASGIMVLTLAILILIKGNRAAVFFLIAMASLVGFGVLVMIPAESFYIKSINFFVPFFIDIGSLLMIVLFSFGLGYRIKLLQKEKEQAERLKEMDRIKSRFFTNISHEFRTPITLISGPLEDMLSECTDPEQKKKYEMMMRNSDRLLRLVNQLLDLSRLESGKMKMNACEQNIIPFIRGIVECFTYIAGQKQQLLSFQADATEILVYFDQEKCEKIFLNLLINAVKFTPAGGKIIIRIVQNDKQTNLKDFPEGCVEIVVTNSGPGIPHEDLDRIFDHFYQVENIGEYIQSGSGIGLALVKELVELHYGTIDVMSTDNKPGEQDYTAFTVRLPLGKGHYKADEIIGTGQGTPNLKSAWHIRDMYIPETAPEESAAGFPCAEDEDHEKRIILVIEDNAEVRTYLRNGLEKNYEVIEAVDGDEGIRKARKSIPDLVISDIMMPVKDGYEVVQVLKSGLDTSHIPIILLTAKASEECIIRGLEHGADDYITKPFNMKIVKVRIRNLIKLRSRLQERMQKQLLLQPAELSFTSMDQKFLKNLNDTIEKNIADQEFNIDVLVEKLFMSKATLNRKIRALTGQSTNQYIQSYRLKKAAQLLQSNFGNVTEVCYAVGFSSSAYFTKCFKEVFHQLPSQFQTVKAS